MSAPLPALKALNSLEKTEPDPAPASGPLPRRLGHLTLLRQVARGGMGEVFLAAAGAIEGAERPCIVKIIRRDHKDDRSFLARFLDEARIQSQLQHPGVAQILEASTSDNNDPYVVVEHVEGRNLGEVRARAAKLGVRMSWPEAVAVCVSIGSALAHVHERTDPQGRPLSIVHRDLSPQNVMLSYGGDTKLIDFGTAKGENRRCHTVSGVVFAKPGYVAPEVANNTPGGSPADLYALGVMLWELVAGRRFLSGEAATHLAEVAAGKRSLPPLAALVGAPADLDIVLARLTATALEERYASARKATADLVDILKRAPSLADGERSVRGRIAQVMQRLYPAEPARSRSEFARLVAEANEKAPKTSSLPAPSPVPSEAAADNVLPGTRFRIQKELGRGAMGIVYQAEHIDLRRQVALKVLPAEHKTNQQRLAEFRSEARAIAKLSHDNLVKLHDFGVAEDGRLFYAMELLHGESLEHYLGKHGGMDYREALRIGVQTCRALEVAHAGGLVHRDIKPANLFMAAGGVVKLLDFGVAKLATDTDQVNAGEVSVAGTPEYLAPEQLSEATPRTDVYSLGVVLYQILTGSLPHEAEGLMALLEAKKQAPVALRQRAPERGLPAAVDRAVMHALEPNPKKRCASAAELRAALEQALGEPRAERKLFRKAVTLGASAALLSLLALGAKMVPEFVAAAQRTPSATSVEPTKASIAAAGAHQQALALPPASLAELLNSEPNQDADLVGQGTEFDAEDTVLDAADVEPAAVVTTDPTANGDQTKSAVEQDAVVSNLVQAEEQMTTGNAIVGFNKIRRLAKKHPGDERVLQAWSNAAIKMKAWGEAHRAARRWVAASETAGSMLQLAKMERATTRGDYKRTLEKLLAKYPGTAEAEELLGLAKPQELAQTSTR